MSETIDQAVCGFTPDDLAQVLSDLLPVGWVWPRDEDAVQQKLLRGLAPELARIYDRDCDLLDESFACGALEALTDWERVLGLPDPCTGLLETIQERRAAVCAKMAVTADMTLESMQTYLRGLGYDVEIEEGPGRFDFTVHAITTTPISFRAGSSVAGERLRTWGNNLLECGIEYIKPAHTRPVMDYHVPSVWDGGLSDWDGGYTIFDQERPRT